MFYRVLSTCFGFLKSVFRNCYTEVYGLESLWFKMGEVSNPAMRQGDSFKNFEERRYRRDS